MLPLGLPMNICEFLYLLSNFNIAQFFPFTLFHLHKVIIIPIITLHQEFSLTIHVFWQKKKMLLDLKMMYTRLIS